MDSGATQHFKAPTDLGMLAVTAHEWWVNHDQEEWPMANHITALGAAALIPLALTLTTPVVVRADEPSRQMFENGLVRVRSIYTFDETIERIKQDVAAKGIMFFFAVDQAKLASEAGLKLRPSTVLVFGNPALGSQFITSNPNAGIDWPVRLLVIENDKGEVWTVYNDFQYIARRHGIADRDTAFSKASEVITSITSSVSR
jgi:uncharacterized protein (DUF302 family)